MLNDTTTCSVQDTSQAQDRALRQVPEVDDERGVDRTVPMSAEEGQSSRRAAWAIGRQLACLRFWLCQAWLTVYHEPSCRLAERAESVWDDLALTVREVAQRIQARDHLRDTIRAAQETWRMMFHSAWHVDAVWNANASIEEELKWYPEMSERFAREEACESLLREIDSLLGGIQGEIEEQLDGDQLAVMRLALLVYEALYPRRAHRYMLALDEEAGQRADEPADGENAEEGEHIWEPEELKAGFAGRCDRQQFEYSPTWQTSGYVAAALATGVQVWHLPRRIVEPASTVPAPVWLREVEQRWAQLGWDAQELPWDSVEEAGRLPADQLVCRIDALAREAVSGAATRATRLPDPEHDAPTATACEPAESRDPNPVNEDGPDRDDGRQPRSEYLGLRLNARMQVVTREGSAYRVHIERRSSWRLLEHLLRQRDRRTTLEWLRDHWDQFGRTQGCASGTIYDAVSELNGHLERLEIAARSSRNLGWRLEDRRAEDSGAV